MRVLVFVSITIAAIFTLACAEDEPADEEPTATASATMEVEQAVPTPTEAPPATAPTEPLATEAPEPTQPQITNRMSCAAIGGTPYLSEEEREWYQANCVVEEPPPIQQPPGEQEPPVTGNCSSSYPTVCIPPAPPDLDCGQIAFRRFTVLPPDPHGFDGDNDGVGCESG